MNRILGKGVFPEDGFHEVLAGLLDGLRVLLRYEAAIGVKDLLAAIAARLNPLLSERDERTTHWYSLLPCDAANLFRKRYCQRYALANRFRFPVCRHEFSVAVCRD